MDNYVIRGGQEGYDRLKVIARAWATSTAALLDRVGVGAGQVCLDLGCGGGDVTLELAGRVGASGRVVGIDMDEVKLDLAAQDAVRAGLRNVEFRRMSVDEWSDPAAYDLVYCRNLTQHLSRPVEVLRAMWAAVRPGGVLVVEDVEFSGAFCDPPNEWHEFWRDSYSRVLRSRGGDPTVGRRLPRLFPAAGVDAPLTVTVSQRVDLDHDAKRIPELTVAATADAIVADGIASTERVQQAIAQLGEYAADPTTMIGSARMFQVWSRRPASAPSTRP
jgi:2-polyprenyl-3-methyl-5-hydroxy-6-metoxy-1,4-benzoquinol methylase